MAGQGTLGIDIMQQVPQADVVVVPVSGGGLISGVATAVKAVQPSTIVVGVPHNLTTPHFPHPVPPPPPSSHECHAPPQIGAEPTGANDCALSKASGQLTRLDTTDTICDGLRLVMMCGMTCEV
jgi:threonine dehydratase